MNRIKFPCRALALLFLLTVFSLPGQAQALYSADEMLDMAQGIEETATASNIEDLARQVESQRNYQQVDLNDRVSYLVYEEADGTRIYLYFVDGLLFYQASIQSDEGLAALGIINYQNQEVSLSLEEVGLLDYEWLASEPIAKNWESGKLDSLQELAYLDRKLLLELADASVGANAFDSSMALADYLAIDLPAPVEADSLAGQGQLAELDLGPVAIADLKAEEARRLDQASTTYTSQELETIKLQIQEAPDIASLPAPSYQAELANQISWVYISEDGREDLSLSMVGGVLLAYLYNRLDESVYQDYQTDQVAFLQAGAVNYDSLLAHLGPAHQEYYSIASGLLSRAWMNYASQDYARIEWLAGSDQAGLTIYKLDELLASDPKEESNDVSTSH